MHTPAGAYTHAQACTESLAGASFRTPAHAAQLAHWRVRVQCEHF